MKVVPGAFMSLTTGGGNTLFMFFFSIIGPVVFFFPLIFIFFLNFPSLSVFALYIKLHYLP